ncbi:MAG: Crp/Fnr family transcriptional regulator [Bacteroidia bacterium]|nr:Crp/Fnr family transcriptional regulator [Bacteroidia bacterium]
MKSECIDCACVIKSSSTLKNCQIELLENNHAVVGFRKGDSIIKQGVFSTNVVFLRKGLAQIHITGPYREQIVRLIKAPTYLGLPTTLGNKINQYSVTAVLDSEVCFIDIEVFRKVLEENREFSSYIIMELSKSELESYRRCANRTQKQTRGNLADVLLDFSDNIFNSDEFVLPISQSDIGNWVDAGRESINRALSEFTADNIIEMTGRNVKILDKKLLKMISQNG